MNRSSTVLPATVSRRRFLQLSALSVAGATVAACVTPAPADSTATEPAMEMIELRFQNWFNESDMHTWQIGLDKFGEERPDVSLKLEFASWGDTTSTILAGAAAGDLPDVFMASDEHVPPVASVGLVLNLNPYIDATPDINVDDFAAGVSRGFNFWGRWWGFPYDQSTWGIYYNKSMFDEAGLDYPPTEGQTQWSLGEFVEAATALTKPDGAQWGTLINSSQYLHSAFIYSAGGRNYDDDGRECLIASPESAAALQWMVDLIYRHQVAPTAAEMAGSGGIDYFTAGLVAMEMQGQWDLQSKNAEVEFDFDIGFLPIDAVQSTVTGGSGFCCSNDTANPDAAWEFLASYTSSETLADMVGRPGRGIPARWSATPAYLEAGGKAAHPGAFVEQLQWAFNDRATLASPQFNDSWARHYGAIYETGEGDIEAALTQIQNETNEALAEKWQSVTIDV